MPQQTINIATANSGTGDDLRTGGDKINDNFDELYGLIPAEPGATADQTGAEIRALLAAEADTNILTDAMVANIRTVEEFQDLVAAMFQAGTHTNASIAYDDVNGTINVTASGSGGGAPLTQEQVEDFVAGVSVAGTGISVTYDDAGNTLTFALTGEVFTTALLNKLNSITQLANPAFSTMSFFNQSAGTMAWFDTLDGLTINGTTLSVDLTAEQARRAEVEEQTATSYDVVAADSGKTKRHNSGSAITVNIPTNATDALAIGHTSNDMQYGAGTVTITAAAGVTLNGIDGGSCTIQTRYRGLATKTKIAANEWLVFGDIDEVT